MFVKLPVGLTPDGLKDRSTTWMSRLHSHPNEQSGYILSGRIRVLTGDSKHELGPGDTYAIPANVEHSIEIIEPAEEVQVFTPPREDFR